MTMKIVYRYIVSLKVNTDAVVDADIDDLWIELTDEDETFFPV